VTKSKSFNPKDKTIQGTDNADNALNLNKICCILAVEYAGIK
jgi:hypothetical protein